MVLLWQHWLLSYFTKEKKMSSTTEVEEDTFFNATFSNSITEAVAFVSCLTNGRMPPDIKTLLETHQDYLNNHTNTYDEYWLFGKNFIRKVSQIRRILKQKRISEIKGGRTIAKIDERSKDSQILTRAICIVFTDDTHVNLNCSFNVYGDDKWSVSQITYKDVKNKKSLVLIMY